MRMSRSSVLGIALALIIFAMIFFAFRGQVGDTLRILRGFCWTYMVAACALAFSNYLIRFIRLEFLLRRAVGRAVGGPTRWASLAIFFSGLAMSVSPGKVGEVLKAGLLKELAGTPLRHSTPVVIIERLADLLGVVLLAAVGLPAFSQAGPIVAVPLVLVALIMLVLSRERLCLSALRAMGRVPFIGRSTAALTDAYRAGRSLITPSSLVVIVPLSVAAWFPECLALWVIIRGLGVDLSLLAATFAYAMATLAGAVTLLPGGLGATEASLAGLLILWHVPGDAALAATLLVRAATLWFAVALGLVALAATRLSIFRASSLEDTSTD